MDALSSVEISRVRVHDVTTQETLGLMRQMVQSGKAHQVVTVNPEFVMRARRDETFAHVLDGADLALPDGQGILWAARMLRKPLRERVTGADTTPRIAALCAREGYSLYLLGAAPGVADTAAARLVAANPGLPIAGVYAGSPSVSEEDEIVARVQAASPDFLLVAYGAPAQDLWIARNLERLGVPVCIGVGGTLDFVAGVVPRAPLWMRKRGLEWLFRLIQNPRRITRMMALPKYGVTVLWSALFRWRNSDA